MIREADYKLRAIIIVLKKIKHSKDTQKKEQNVLGNALIR